MQICSENGWGGLIIQGQRLGPQFQDIPPRPEHATFPARVPRCNLYTAYWSWFKNGIQVFPHKLPGFDAYEDGRELPSLDEWIAAQLDDMPKYGNDYYVSCTMFWRVLISLMRIRDAGVPYYFCHSVEVEDWPHDMHEEKVLCRMRIVRLWPEMSGNRVLVIPDGEKFTFFETFETFFCAVTSLMTWFHHDVSLSECHK
jgi:hypothetical protein